MTHKIRGIIFNALLWVFPAEIILMLGMLIKYGLLEDQTAIVAVSLTGLNLIILGFVSWDTLQLRKENESKSRL